MPLWGQRILQVFWVFSFLGVLFGGLAYIIFGSIPPAPVPFAGAEIPNNLLVVTSRSWYQPTLFGTESFAAFQKRPATLKWLANGPVGVELGVQPPNLRQGPALILVHGYGAPESKVLAYFAGVLPLLRRSLAPDTTIILYDWPSRARHWHELSAAERRSFMDPGGHSKSVVRPSAPVDWERDAYRDDWRAARGHGAEGLALLLRLLANKGVHPLRIVAHSMGGAVVTDALKRLGNTTSAIEVIVLLAPDLPSDVFDDADVRLSVRLVRRIEILHSVADQALFYSQVANLGPRLGRRGILGKLVVPLNVRAHDVTEKLGEGIEVHSRYLEPEWATRIRLGELVAAQRTH